MVHQTGKFQDVYVDETDTNNAKGEPINIDQPIIRKFRRKADFAHPRLPFSTSVVKSDVDRKELPIQIGPDAEILCALEADLSGIDESHFKGVKRGLLTRRQTYLEVEYDIQVIIGISDVRFDLSN